MFKHDFIRGVLVLLTVIGTVSCSEETPHEKLMPGLIGAYYGNADFTRIKLPEELHSLDLHLNENVGHGDKWSGVYVGYLMAPVSAKVTFRLRTNQQASFKVGDKKISAKEDHPAQMVVNLKKDKRYPVRLTYQNLVNKESFLRVIWSWKGKEETVIPIDQFVYDSTQAAYYNYPIEPDPQTIDYTKFIYPQDRRTVIVYSEKGKFAGWPANGGIWHWDNEILVAFTVGTYKANPYHHSIDDTKPKHLVFARSTDGGEHWVTDIPEHYWENQPLPPLKRIDFNRPGLAIRISGNTFFVSYDKGKNWHGPQKFPDFNGKKLTSRTDYQVISKDSCLFFLSFEEDKVEARLQDNTFCALTIDGGKTFRFLSLIGKPFNYRSVMPSTVRIGKDHYVTALRRRYDERFKDPNRPHLAHDWIDVFETNDGGNTWHFLSKVADTDMAKYNGNPPSLVKMKDGRLCITYGYRSQPLGIRAKISDDNGKTWGQEIHLRDHARSYDMGYTRSVQREDGKIVTIYYYTTQEIPQEYIEATIWDPVSVPK